MPAQWGEPRGGYSGKAVSQGGEKGIMRAGGSFGCSRAQTTPTRDLSNRVMGSKQGQQQCLRCGYCGRVSMGKGDNTKTSCMGHPGGHLVRGV